MNDGSIGKAGSGASSRANADCYNLFVLLFNNIPDAWAQLFQPNTFTGTTRAAYGSADAAWNAGAHVSLTRQLGRSLTIAGTGGGLTNHVLGSFDGAESVTLATANLAYHQHIGPDHQHVSTLGNAPYYMMSDGSVYSVDNAGIGSAIAAYSTTGIQQFTSTVYGGGLATGPSGSGTPTSIIPPRSFWNIMIKL